LLITFYLHQLFTILVENKFDLELTIFGLDCLFSILNNKIV